MPFLDVSAKDGRAYRVWRVKLLPAEYQGVIALAHRTRAYNGQRSSAHSRRLSILRTPNLRWAEAARDLLPMARCREQLVLAELQTQSMADRCG